MKPYLLSIILASVLCLSGISGCACCCTQQPPACKDKIKTVTSGGITSTYTYDTTGRVVLITKSDGSSVSYTYATGSATEVITPMSGTANTIVYTLNSAGLAVSDSRGVTYQYDSNGFTIQSVYPSFTDTRTITNGNIVSETRTGNSPVTYTVTYTSTRDCQDFGLYFLGNHSVNLRQTQTATDGTPPITYTFQFANGKVTSETVTGGASYVATYTYY